MSRSSNHELIEKICHEAERCEGTRFHHQGRLPKYMDRKGRGGMDCVGLWVHVLKTIGYDLKGPSDYKRQPEPSILVGNIEKAFEQICISDMARGDMIMFWFEEASRAPQHVGIYTGNNMMIHAYLPRKRVCKEDLNGPLRSNIHSVWRFKWQLLR